MKEGLEGCGLCNRDVASKHVNEYENMHYVVCLWFISTFSSVISVDEDSSGVFSCARIL